MRHLTILTVLVSFLGGNLQAQEGEGESAVGVAMVAAVLLLLGMVS